MALNYALGGDPKKKKKVKRSKMPAQNGRTPEERMKRFDNPVDRKKMETTMKINTQSKKMIDEGMATNEYGLPAGEQKHKKFRKLVRSIVPKFRRKSSL